MSTGKPDFIKSHPREALQLGLAVGFFIWQSGLPLLGLGLYWLLAIVMRVPWWLILLGGILIAGVVLLLEYYYLPTQLAPLLFLHQGLTSNLHFWRHVITNGWVDGLYFMYANQLEYLLGFGLFAAGCFALGELIPCSPHLADMEALKKKQLSGGASLVSKELIDTALRQLNEAAHEGTVIGVSQTSGQYLVIPDKDINQIGLVLGTTGGGKTITLRRFYKRAIAKGYPLIIVDGKPSEENVTWVMELAKASNRAFHGFNCGNHHHYDPLAYGGYTELKDKIISLKDQWESDYYRSIAEDYLQTTFEVLIKSGKAFDLKAVAECLNYDVLCLLVRGTDDDALKKRVERLKDYQSKDITGLKAHLHILIHSELGEYFKMDPTTFTLADVIKENAVVYFALPALRFPSFSKVLGKLVMNDLKAVIDRQDKSKKIVAVFDEFSVFAGEQGLNLVNMGREKGLHSIFGTQGLAELDKVDKTFRQQLMNCVNTILCHRLNDHESAEIVSGWAGTQDTFNVTAQINVKENDAGMGSVKQSKEFIIHPDSIKQGLDIGEAFYITKVGGFRWDRVKVRFG